MTVETSDVELGLLQRRARTSGHYVNRHRWYDPARGGDLYLSKAKRVRTDPTEPWIMKFSTVAQIESRLAKIEEANAWEAKKARRV